LLIHIFLGGEQLCTTKNQIKMSIITSTQAEILPSKSRFNVPFIANFLNWSKEQEDNRILWVCIALAGHGCVITPLTVLAVAFAGMNLYLFMLALIAMGISLVTNLAAMPAKVTIPVFLLSVLIDIVVVVAAIVSVI
jgi:hypothetical protein